MKRDSYNPVNIILEISSNLPPSSDYLENVQKPDYNFLDNESVRFTEQRLNGFSFKSVYKLEDTLNCNPLFENFKY